MCFVLDINAANRLTLLGTHETGAYRGKRSRGGLTKAKALIFGKMTGMMMIVA